MKKLTVLSMLSVAGLAVAQSADQPTSTSYMTNANPPAAGVVTGAAKGRVVFDGKKEDVKPLTIDPKAAEGCTHGDDTVDAVDRSLLIDDKGGVANVVVTIDVADAKVEVPETPIHLDQKGCRFEPHVMIIPVGSTVEFLNSDGVSHNVHTYPTKNDAMNKLIPAGSKETQVLDKADRIEIKCDIHPWMNSHLIVSDTPFVAVSGADGSFEIPDLPAGDYKVKIWHEKLGKADAEVTIAADGSSAPIEVTLGKKKAGGRRRRR
jgi:plastocyanin